jgi:dihydrodipicolinate synthase/N-acetylneuraminate lyase
MKSRLRGIFPPIPTIFDASGRIDRRAMSDNIRRWMATDLTGVLALGSNGEAALLDEDESRAIVERRARARAARARPARRVDAVHAPDDFGREARREAGADAVLVRTPFFYKSQMTARR